MPDLLQESNFIFGVLEILLRHIPGLDALDHIVLAFTFVSRQVDLTE